MKRGLFLSFLLHCFVLILAVLNWPEFFPRPEVKVMRVSLVAAPNVKKSPDAAKPEPVKTQQSAAPKAPPKKVEAPKPTPKPKNKKVVKVKDKKPEEPKVVEKKPVEEKENKVPEKKDEKQVAKDAPRPEKLDKTPDKKNVLKDPDADKKKAPVTPPEDFMKAMAFIDALKDKQSEEAENALTEGEKTEETTITLADQHDIGILQRHIERNWYKPAGIAGRFIIEVLVKVNRDGTLDDLEVVTSSGKAFFDSSLLRAIRKSVPLPLPAEKYELFKEIILAFDSEKARG